MVTLSPQDQATLLQLARMAIATGVTERRHMMVETTRYPEALQAKRATFVTLTLNGELRGCIGNLDADRSLVEDVVHNAGAAALSDPRFPPVTAAEIERLRLQISVLNPAKTMTFDSERDLIRQLRPGIDGLILQDDNHRATFLPSVWESLPDPAGFIQHLKLKAGLPADYWSATVKVSRYTTMSFKDPECPPALPYNTLK